MDALASWDDILVPGKIVPCVDNELLHPEFVASYRRQFGEIAGKSIDDGEGLIEAFFALDRGCGYAGFKSMPNRHERFETFVARSDLRFTVLLRRDVTATVASFAVAARTGSWRRRGGPPAVWTFRSEDRSRVLDLIAYIYRSIESLKSVPSAIRLSYEDLCDPSYSSRELDDFFGRSIKLRAPNPPVRPEDYVTNYSELDRFVRAALKHLAA